MSWKSRQVFSCIFFLRLSEILSLIGRAMDVMLERLIRVESASVCSGAAEEGRE